jgi:putative CocE/NonD family hydrolase
MAKLGSLHSLSVDLDVPVPMRDGTILRADVYRPSGPGRYPVLLKRTPYDKGEPGRRTQYLDPMRAGSHGFAVVIQDVRGRYASEGEFYPFVNEMSDGYDTVEWCASQPWSNGKVGMFGRSYHGATQWLAACAGAPGLGALYPGLTSSDYHESWTYQGGALCWGFLVSWVTNGLVLDNFGKLARDKGYTDATKQSLIRAVDEMPREFRHLPPKDYPYIKDGLAPYFYDWLDHPDADEYWARIRIEDRHDQINLPVFNTGGWFDCFLKGTIRNFTGMRARRGEVGTRQRLLLGPWHHAKPYPSVSGTTYFGMHASEGFIDLVGTVLRWYGRWLRDDDNGIEKDPPVQLFVMGKNFWRYEREWPLPQTQFTPYFLHSKGKANTLNGDGVLSRDPPGGEPPDVYLYDPRDPVPTIGGGSCCYVFLTGGQYDQRRAEARPDVLCYTTPPLTEDVEVTGPLTMQLYAVCSQPDTDLTAKLVDVCPDGCASNVADGIIRARYREGLATQKLIQPGEAYRYEIDLWATANTFRKGHCIRLEISSSNFPRFDRNPNTGRTIATESELIPAVITVLHDADHPSQIVLPLIPA